MKTTKDQKGFTLAEVLVTVGIFAIVSMVSSSIFINVNNLQQQSGNLQRLQNEGRYLLEKIAKEIRGRELDYRSTILFEGGMTQELIDKEDEFGEVMNIVFDGSNQAINLGINGLVEQLNSDQVIIESLQFRVNPTSDPYDASGEVISSFQPRVTVYLRIKNKEVPEKYLKKLNLQTTISSKVYKQ